MDGPPFSSDDDEEVKHDLAILGPGVFGTALSSCCAACALVLLKQQAENI